VEKARPGMMRKLIYVSTMMVRVKNCADLGSHKVIAPSSKGNSQGRENLPAVVGFSFC